MSAFLLRLSCWVAGFFVVYGALGRLFPCVRGQKLLRREMLTDMLYWFIIPLFGSWVRIAYLSLGATLVYGLGNHEEIGRFLKEGHGTLKSVPLWLQMALIMLISDFILYWAHRLFHTGKWWEFHTIHHSPAVIDWTTAARFHPVNLWLTFTLVDALMLIAGFSPAALAALVPVNMIYSTFVHANLNWTLGPFRYVLASPVFHRWHHTQVNEGGNRNFAPTFPLLDVLFGTFYMPEGRLPEHYGVQGREVPDDFLRQLVYPFKGL